MKKRMMAMGLCMTMAVSMAGCGGSSSSATAEVADGPYAGQELNVFLWPEYIPDSVIGDFEDAFGVKVNVSTYSSNEEMLSKLENSADGTYDIINPSDYMVEYMAGESLLAELDMDILTNYSNLDPAYLGQFYDPDDKYAVPFAPGEIIVAYNKDLVPDGIDSLSDLFADEFASSLVVLDDPKIVIGMVNKSLGYSLNETDESNLAETKDAMMALKDNIYSLKFEGTQDMLVTGECAAGYIFNGSVAYAQMDSDSIGYLYPEEGSYIWIDTLCIPANSAKQDLANEFINYILDAEVDAKIREEIPSSDPNAAGWALVSDEVKDVATALIIPEESWANSEYAMNLPDDINTLYTNMYAEFTQ